MPHIKRQFLPKTQKNFIGFSGVEVVVMTHSQAVQNALQVMDNHIIALNAHNEKAIADSLHFPHIRLSAAEMKLWPTADSYFQDFKSRAGDGWHHSAFEDIQILAESDTKVHLDARIIRYNKKNDVIGSFRSLWVITYEEGRWAAKIRSSFAAK